MRLDSNVSLGSLINQAPVNNEDAKVIGAAVLSVEMAALISAFAQSLKGNHQAPLQPPQMPVSPPDTTDGFQQWGGLSVDSSTGTVTTPGGYKITQIGQYHWAITDPDGQSVTDVSGDPHVNPTITENDGKSLTEIAQQEGLSLSELQSLNPSLTDATGALPPGTVVKLPHFDFQENAVFALPDGTKIGVTTTPWGSAGAHVTSGLTIMSGTETVNVTGIDKGTGQVSQVQNTGYRSMNAFAGDPVLSESAPGEWSFQGQQILGGTLGNNQQLQLGQAVNVTQGYGGGSNWAQQIANELDSLFRAILGGPGLQQMPSAPNPYQTYRSPRPVVQASGRQLSAANISRAFGDLGTMFNALADYTSITSQAGRRVYQ